MTKSLIVRMADKFGVDQDKMLNTLKETAFKAGKEKVTNEQMMALLIVADQYNLNPWTKEIYAFPDKGGIVPVIGVDGWIRMMQSHEQFDGIQYEETPDHCTAVIYRKDQSHPTKVTEYMDECRRDTSPWRSHPRRMLRHKATIQAARLAFGFAGIYEPDEAERIIEKDVTPDTVKQPERAVKDLSALTAPTPAPEQEKPTEAPTFAQVADMINNSQSEEESRAALDMTEGMDPQWRADLAELHVNRWKQADMLEAQQDG